MKDAYSGPTNTTSGVTGHAHDVCVKGRGQNVTFLQVQHFYCGYYRK